MVLRMTYTTDAPAQDDLLTTGDVARRLNYSRSRVHQLVKSGELRATQPGGPQSHYRIRPADLAKFLADSPTNQSDRWLGEDVAEFLLLMDELRPVMERMRAFLDNQP